MGVEEIVDPVLDTVVATGGGWPVLVLLIVIAVIAYLAKSWMDRQAKVNEQRMVDRKLEFEAQLERERQNANNYQDTTNRMVNAFDQNSRAMAELTGVIRPMGETLTRIDRHIESQNRRKGAE